jgi:hypothetical protein
MSFVVQQCRQEEGSNSSWVRLRRWELEAHTRRGAEFSPDELSFYLVYFWNNSARLVQFCIFLKKIWTLFLSLEYVRDDSDSVSEFAIALMPFFYTIAAWTAAQSAVTCQGTTGVWGSATEGPLIVLLCHHIVILVKAETGSSRSGTWTYTCAKRIKVFMISLKSSLSENVIC